MHDPSTCTIPSCDTCATLSQRGAALLNLELQLKEKMARERRAREHRMNNPSPRTDAQKRVRTKARSVRKRQKASRRRNRG